MRKYTSIDRIFSKLIRDVTEDFSESDVIEWCGEALEFIQAQRSYQERIAFIEVKNHQCSVPKGCHAIIQVAKDNHWRGPNIQSLCAADILPAVETKDNEVSIPVALDCNGEPVNAYELAYYRPYFDLKWEYQGWTNTGLYNRFTPIRLSTNTLFDSLVCKETDQSILSRYSGSQDEYKIIDGEIIRLSFREGFIAVPYLGQMVDPNTGYPMIPDNISYTTAIVKYVTMMMDNKEFRKGREGASSRLEESKREWQWYCKQASNLELMPQGVDEHQNLLEQRSYLLPRQNRYYGFFGNLNKQEYRKYNHPNRRY